VAHNIDGLRIIDISDPTAPAEVKRFHVMENAAYVYVSGSYAYVAEGLDGLGI